MISNRSPERPETKFVETPKGHVAYQAFGASGPDLVFLTNWITNLDAIWDEPSAARYLDALAAFGRVIQVDKRGSGVSDTSSRGYIDPVEDALDDITVVLDEVGSEEAILIGDTEGGMLACVLAATYPQRFPSLILVNSYARFLRADDYPVGAPAHVIDTLSRQWRELYGVSADTLSLTAPSVASDPRFRSWYTRFQRLSMHPAIARQALEWIRETDVRSILPLVQSRTLVINREDARFHRLAFGEYLAEHIPDARLVVVPGSDTLPFHAGDATQILQAMEEFVTGRPVSAPTERMLATVVFGDIVGSTALAAKLGDQRWLDLRTDHDRLVRENLARFRGNEVSMTGDGFVATFDSPLRAIQCGLALRAELDRIGLKTRVGIHTGEIEMRNGVVGGIALHIGARVMAVAEEGGVLASGTVKDLVVGSHVEFKECGLYDLKGVPGSWALFEVAVPSPS